MSIFSSFSRRLATTFFGAEGTGSPRAALAVLLLAACGGGPDVTAKPGDEATGATGGATASGGTGTGGRPTIVDPGEGGEAGEGEEPDPCAVAAPPPECFEIGPSGPACGDGELNQAGEVCDDGNSLPGDGCSGVCTVEPYWECPRPGRPCRMTIACGDRSKDPGEVCDDGNRDDDDGCSADCLTQDPSYVCSTPGEPCILLFRCGDRRVNGSETCDDGNDDAGDGCSDRCRLEDGYACARPGQGCTRSFVCGDGRREGTEQCDDGGVTPDDGCSAQCRTEADWVCAGATGAQSTCMVLVVCGDGIVNGNEACDDDNTTGSDGCAANCMQVESGYACARAGHACRPVCGDGLKRGDEQCDDDNTANGDGCNSGCRLEDSTVCTGEGAGSCRATVCGSNGREGNEACDDNNNVPFDGCFQCRREPTCTGGACVAVCGDGQRYSNEQCDDGDTTPGDGCSATCTVEPGYACSDNTSTPPATREQPVTYRDFIGVGRTAGGSTAHTDFNQLGGSGVIGITETALNASGKPVYACPGGVCNNNPGRLYRGNNGGDRQSNMSNAANFAQWYTDVPGVNITSYGSVLLTRNATTGNYVFDSGAGSYFDPIGTGGWVALGKETRTCSPARNVSFTSETRFWFEYNGGEFFEFAGDDDTWVFVAGQLAVDLGGLHTPRTGDFTLDADTDGAGADTADGTAVARMFNMPALPYTTATPPGAYQPGANFSRTLNLGLVPGQVYEVAMFQAERNECGSNFKITLKNFNKPRSICTPVCGDETITPGEECDDGNATTTAPNNTSTPVYGGCLEGTCTLGPYCGDGTRDQPQEACDDGVNRSQWGQSGCAPGCALPPSCGDGQIDAAFEECDLGAGNTASGYGGCTTSCTIGPSCGDGAVQNPPETCDDGVNDGFYGSCTPECAPGPRCGDGDLQEEWGEECDSSDADCIHCRLGAQCGDQVVQSGEDCDDGVNDGGYGECGPRCKYGPRCGDGVANGDEDCDDGDGHNTGGYGMCAPGCVYGPYCGDDRVQSAFEQCDDGNNRNGDGCSSACKNEQSIPR